MNNNNEILFAKTKQTAIIPSKKEEDAGFDIYACWEGTTKGDRIIQPHCTKLIPTGIACCLPTEYYFQVEERGSTGSKGIKRSAGVIDSGYRGEIFIAITNVNNCYVIFDNKENYLEEALKELESFQNVDINNLTEQDKQNLEDFLVRNLGEDYKELDEDTKNSIVKKVYQDIQHPSQRENLIRNIENAIFYPDTKAIAQLILHKVDNLPTKEISYETLKEIPSQRGVGNLGSSGK